MRSRLQCVPLAWVLAASLAAPHGLAAATPPPLPPDTVNQLGLSWDLHAIGTRLATTPFRFSLCEGRYLAPDEVSVPCRPSNRATVHGGHNAEEVLTLQGPRLGRTLRASPGRSARLWISASR